MVADLVGTFRAHTEPLARVWVQQLLDKLTRHLRKSGLPVKTLQYEEGGSPGMGGPPSLVRTIIIRGDIP